MPEPNTVQNLRPEVRCGNCHAKIFDGLMLKSRVIRVLPKGAEAKCRCKRWVPVPLTYEKGDRK